MGGILLMTSCKNDDTDFSAYINGNGGGEEPSAAIITVLCSRYNKNAKLAAEGAASTTFFSLGTLALWTLFLTEMFL